MFDCELFPQEDRQSSRWSACCSGKRGVPQDLLIDRRSAHGKNFFAPRTG